MTLKKHYLVLMMTSFLYCNAEPNLSLRDHFFQRQKEELVKHVKILASKFDAVLMINFVQYMLFTAILFRLWQIGKLLERRY